MPEQSPPGENWYVDDGLNTQIAPYPGEILILGGFRWLTPTGRLLYVPSSLTDWANQENDIAIAEGEDPQKLVGELFGTAVDLTARTLEFWENAAAKGGYVLSELIQ